MKIGVFGAGYVGLVTGVCLASIGHDVIITETDQEKVSILSQGNSTIVEPGLPELMRSALAKGKLHFTTSAVDVVSKCEVIFLCVGTPSRQDGSADMSQIEGAMRTIVEQIQIEKMYRLVVVKSTVPVGTATWLSRTVKLYGKGRNIAVEVASNPEFLREGAAVQDFMNPDRIVFGTSSERGAMLLSEVYESFSCPKITTDSHTAEIIKYAANSFLATKISFINMVSDLCESVGADIQKVAHTMGFDPRIGPDFLKAGLGFGGSCFPKDLRAFAHVNDMHNVDSSLLRSVIAINELRPTRVIQRLRDMLWVLNGKRIAVLGLTFKPNTDDVRETPAFEVIRLLKNEGAIVCATDPTGFANFQRMYPEIAESVTYNEDPLKTVADCHAAVLVTNWTHYTDIDWSLVKSLMQFPIILDGRNSLDASKLRHLGFEYASIGSSM